MRAAGGGGALRIRGVWCSALGLLVVELQATSAVYCPALTRNSATA